MSAVRYLQDHFTRIEADSDDCPPYGQSASGYGRKIATPYKLRLNGKGPWRRVYAVCFSNVASHYVLVKGQAFYLGQYDPRENWEC